MPDMLGAYNVRRKRDPKSYPEKTLGWLINWFTDPAKCPEFGRLAVVRRKSNIRMGCNTWNPNMIARWMLSHRPIFTRFATVA